MDRETLIQLVLDLYRSDKSVEQSINLRLVGEAYRDAVVAASEDEELYKLWKDRLEGVLHAFDGFGWGMGSIYPRRITCCLGYRKAREPLI